MSTSLRRSPYRPGDTSQDIDHGPETPYSPSVRRYGSPVGSMSPVMSAEPLPISAAERARRARQSETRRAAACGVLMPVAGEVCARKPGHADHHRSARGMQAEADKRRGIPKLRYGPAVHVRVAPFDPEKWW